MPNDNDLDTPAYVSFATFKSLVKRLKDTAIPPVIDSSVLTWTSGGTASQLKTALRFLNLTDDSGRVTTRLRDLVDAQGESNAWRGEWRAMVEDAYGPIIKKIDLNNATHQQLRDAFRDSASAKGSVLTKAVRFFIAALEEAGIEYSPHFKVRGAAAAARTAPGGNGGATKAKRRRKRVRSPSGKDGEVEGETPIPEGWDRFDLPLPARDRASRIELPSDLGEREWRIVRDYIEGYYGFSEGDGA